MLNRFRKSNKGFTLVELMIVVAIIGILAALAIPAFLKYIKSSKAAEATMVMRKMADGAKSYFTSSQSFSKASTGDQPWHVSNATDKRPGLPVAWADQVFPGSAITVVSVPAIPTGGAKMMPDFGAASAEKTATLNKLNFAVEDPMYFQYTYVSSGKGAAAKADITARHAFNAVEAKAHTVEQNLSVATSQEVLVSPPYVSNEFE